MLGVFGEIHPKVLSELGVKGPAVGFTLYPAEIPLPRSKGSSRPALKPIKHTNRWLPRYDWW